MHFVVRVITMTTSFLLSFSLCVFFPYFCSCIYIYISTFVISMMHSTFSVTTSWSFSLSPLTVSSIQTPIKVLPKTSQFGWHCCNKVLFESVGTCRAFLKKTNAGFGSLPTRSFVWPSRCVVFGILSVIIFGI